MNVRSLLATAAALAAFGVSAAAQAQQASPWLSDRRAGEGIGIQAGNLELHPGIAGQIGYDTNYFQRADNEREIAAYRFRLIPSLSLQTLSGERQYGGKQKAPPKVNINAQVSATYNEFIAADGDDSDDVSRQRDVALNAGGSITILPQRPWGGDIHANYVRQIEPSNTPNRDIAFDRNTIVAGAGVTWTPGGGVFSWRLGYQFKTVLFERTAFRDFNNTTHQINTRGRWRFLPRTALLYRAEFGFLSYTRDGSTQASGQPMRAMVGLNGLITNRLAFLGMVGWGATFYDSNNGEPVQDFDSLVADAQLTYFIIADPSIEPDSAAVGLSSIAVGYKRNFQNSYLGNYFTLDRGYMKFSYFLGGQFVATVTGGLTHYSYPTSFFADGTVQSNEFGENRIDAELFGEYRLSDTFGLNGTVRYDANLSRRVDASPGGASQDNLDFQRWQFYLGARWFM